MLFLYLIVFIYFRFDLFINSICSDDTGVTPQSYFSRISLDDDDDDDVHTHAHTHHALVWEDEASYRAEDEEEEERDEESGGVNIIIREEHVKHSRLKEGVCVVM